MHFSQHRLEGSRRRGHGFVGAAFEKNQSKNQKQNQSRMCTNGLGLEFQLAEIKRATARRSQGGRI